MAARSGHFNYFVSGDYTTNTLGIESPDGSQRSAPRPHPAISRLCLLQDILDQNTSISAVLGTSNAIFQIPNQVGLQPPGMDGIVGLGPQNAGSGDFVLNANGTTGFPVAEPGRAPARDHPLRHRSAICVRRDRWIIQVSVFGRYSSLFFTPGNNVGDILYNGLAQTAYKRDVAYGLQAEGAWHAFSGHTIRFGVLYQADDTLIAHQLAGAGDGAGRRRAIPIPIRCAPIPTQTCQTSATPLSIADNGSKHGYSYSLYAQDEWDVTDNLTINYGLRYDAFAAYDKENQLSPRINGVWKPTDTTTIHAGYARYFSPPPFELVASTSIGRCSTTPPRPRPARRTTRRRAERADYYDIGAEQKLFDALDGRAGQLLQGVQEPDR